MRILRTDYNAGFFLQTAFLLILTILFKISLAQPGWQNLSKTYRYTIHDKSNKLIKFKSNPAYSILIDSNSFKENNIPSDTMPRLVCCLEKFYQLIQINDFSFLMPEGTNPHVGIIYGNDTMHLGLYDNIELELEFEPGYFYFPYWANNVIGKKNIKAGGNAVIKNLEQSFFKISSEQFLKYLKPSRSNANKNLEAEVTDHFIQASVQTGYIETAVGIKNKLPIYTAPHWDGKIWPTADSNIFAGMIEYRLDTGNLYTGKTVFSLFNKNQHAITHWLPANDPELFYTYNLLFNKYKKMFYIGASTRPVVKDPYGSNAEERYPFKRYIYSSSDYGEHWKISPLLSTLYRKYDIRETAFLDSNHTMLFRRATINYGKKNRSEQGTYFLLHNGRIIDSLKTPDNVFYNGNYNGYNYTRINDTTAQLGFWGIIPENYNSPFNTCLLVKTSGNWKFVVRKDSASLRNISPADRMDDIADYQNFTLINRKKIICKHSVDTLVLNNQINHVLEKDDCIFLLMDYSVLMSFDAGKSWIFYPKPLNVRSTYSFLEIDPMLNIIFYDLGLLKKFQYHFKPLN